MKDIEKRLNKIHTRYVSDVDGIANKLQPFIEFEFNLFYQDSDGFVIGYENEKSLVYNGALYLCISIIKEKGKLSLEDYLNECTI